MTISLPIQNVKENFSELVSQLYFGDTVTVLGDDGIPIAIMFAVKSRIVQRNHSKSRQKIKKYKDWLTEWDQLAQEIGTNWKPAISAVEAVAEQRR